MLNKIRQFLKNDSGAAAVEYGLITSGISVAIIPSVTGVGTSWSRSSTRCKPLSKPDARSVKSGPLCLSLNWAPSGARFFFRAALPSGRLTRSPLIKVSIHLPKWFCYPSARAVEYGLITSGISVAIIPSVIGVGNKLVTIFTTIQTAL
jgi:Flp pilus assembly pilin Flp